jgi:glycosyltransferase involved in cell wall biosynthesis
MNQTVPEVAHVLAGYGALEDCDIVHDHTVVGPLVGSLLGGAPIVTTLHSALDDELRAIYANVAQRATVVAISNAQRAGATGVAIARVIHHGIEPAAFPVGRGEGGYLLFLGRMAPEKGVHHAIEIARRARVPLLIAARMQGHDEHQYFEERVRPRLGSGAWYVGEVGREAKLKLLANARALVNPIRWPEPFGLVMVEALACGTPVVAFREGAAPEIVSHGRTGFLCSDDDEMTHAVARVDEIDRGACRAAVTSRFTTARMVSEYAELFSRILDARTPRPRAFGVDERGGPRSDPLVRGLRIGPSVHLARPVVSRQRDRSAASAEAKGTADEH